MGYKLLLFLYIVIWVLLAMANQVMHYFHSQARRRGYFEFVASTKIITEVPILIWSAGMAFIGLLFVFVPAGTTLWGLKPIGYLQIFCSLQFICITISTVWYCGKFPSDLVPNF